MVMFGGSNEGTSFNDLWILTNANGIPGGGLNNEQVLPNHGGNAGAVTATIVGTGFQPGATVKLTGVGPDIVGSNTNVLGGTSLTTTFDLTGVASGPRTLVV